MSREVGGGILVDTLDNPINPATEDKQNTIITSLADKTSDPISFEDTSFITVDSPVVLDLNTPLGQNATSGTITNDGVGNFTFALSNNGIAYGSEITIKKNETYEFDKLSVNKIRITWIADSAYRVSAV